MAVKRRWRKVEETQCLTLLPSPIWADCASWRLSRSAARVRGVLTRGVPAASQAKHTSRWQHRNIAGKAHQPLAASQHRRQSTPAVGRMAASQAKHTSRWQDGRKRARKGQCLSGSRKAVESQVKAVRLSHERGGTARKGSEKVVKRQ